MEKRITIGIDPGNGDSKAVAVICGKSPKLIIIDEYCLMDNGLRETLEKETLRVHNMDFSELEKRILAYRGDLEQLEFHEYPMKAQMDPVVKHDPHPKAKAKMPYYHQRRRY